MINPNPIFITGLDRSGTNLLYALLASHPNISMSRRTNMFHYFYEKYGDLSQEENFENCLTTMLRYHRFRHLEPDPQRIRMEFWEGEPTYGRLFALFHEHRAEQIGKTRWGDKSLRSERYADSIFFEFPRAKIIHLVRDPRDRYASVEKRYDVNRGKVGANTGKWLYSANFAKTNLRKYSASYMVLRYETLAIKPEESLKEVCEFINEEYTPLMLTMDGAPEHRDQGGNSSFGKFEPGTISTKSIGRYREVLTKSDIAFIQKIARNDMRKFEYSSESILMNPGERLRYAFVKFPMNLARMSIWYFLEKNKQRKGIFVPEYRLTSPEIDSAIESSITQST